MFRNSRLNGVFFLTVGRLGWVVVRFRAFSFSGAGGGLFGFSVFSGIFWGFFWLLRFGDLDCKFSLLLFIGDRVCMEDDDSDRVGLFVFRFFRSFTADEELLFRWLFFLDSFFMDFKVVSCG